MDKQFIQQKLKEITDKIVKEFRPEKIILFGSWAWGIPDKDSDVDLLVVKKTDKPRLERQREIDGLLFPRDTALDILVYTPEELETGIHKNRNLFLEDIVRNGKTLYAQRKNDAMIFHSRPLVVLS